MTLTRVIPSMVSGLSEGSTLETTPAAATVTGCGIMIPYYIYPNNPYTDVTFQSLISLIRSYRSVRVAVILNPSSGPGAVWDGNYAAAITLLRASGAEVLGYVSTAYAGTIDPTRTEAAVKADILAWTTLYAATPISGCFLDEMPYSTAGGAVALYERYTAYAHNLSLYPVVGNPGTNQQEAWFASPTSDIIVVHETGSWPVEGDMYGLYVGGHSNYPISMRAALVYGQSTLDPAKVRWLRKYVDWLYINSDTLPNPWDSLPSYLEQLFAALPSTPALSYDLSLSIAGPPTDGEVILRFVAPRALSFLANFSGSRAKAGVAATASTVFTVATNGSSIGTITFGISGTTGTFASSGGTTKTLAAGDVLTITGPTPADLTLGDIGFTLSGERLS